MNHIVLMGRLTRDIELRRTQNGTAVANFTLAVDRRFKDKETGERQTDFLDIVCWAGLAEHVEKWFSKGQMAAVSGSLQLRDWTDKDENRRRSAEVVADNVYFCGGSRDSGTKNVAETGENGGYTPPVSDSDFEELDMDEGDLPF